MFLIKLCTATFFCLLLSACDDRPDWTPPYNTHHTGSYESDHEHNAGTRYLPTTNEHYLHSETKKLLRFPVFSPQPPDTKGTQRNTIVPAIMPVLDNRPARMA